MRTASRALPSLVTSQAVEYSVRSAAAGRSDSQGHRLRDCETGSFERGRIADVYQPRRTLWHAGVHEPGGDAPLHERAPAIGALCHRQRDWFRPSDGDRKWYISISGTRVPTNIGQLARSPQLSPLIVSVGCSLYVALSFQITQSSKLLALRAQPLLYM